MDSAQASHLGQEEQVAAWKRRTPWLRRFIARFGLQGKLVGCFVLLLALSIGASCRLFLTQSRVRVLDMLGEQTQQIAAALALATSEPMASGRISELQRIGEDLIKSRNILFVAYLDAKADPAALATRDPAFQPKDLGRLKNDTTSLMQVHEMESPIFGHYIEVAAPILATVPGPAGQPHNTRLVGYVAVGLSPARDHAQLNRISYFVIGIGCIIGLLSLPMAYALVHRVFLPIRQLVDATNKIAAGDLSAQVAVDRPDLIGKLSRSFNEMVGRVRDANQDLEDKVQQRTSQLNATNKRLSAEIAEKEDFLRAVSHDLNAPLRNISGMAAMLLLKYREKFDEDVIHRLERIQKNVEVETDLITELLELSRIKTRRDKLEAVDVELLVNELGDVFENDLKSRDIDLVIDTPLPVLHVERARLRQVLQNLIDNAIKYMGTGHGKAIHIGSRLKLTEVEFYVRDTGIGIDPEDIDKVFFVFRRGKNCDAEHIAGKGVGLASVKSIIETYSGSIWVESEKGKGSTFRFTINGKHVPRISGFTDPNQARPKEPKEVKELVA